LGLLYPAAQFKLASLMLWGLECSCPAGYR